MPLKIPAALRARLADRNYTVEAYQPVSLFRGTRKLANVPNDDDPWSVTVYRAGMAPWADHAVVGRATADTLPAAIERAMGVGGLLGAFRSLTGALDSLTAVIRG